MLILASLIREAQILITLPAPCFSYNDFVAGEEFLTSNKLWWCPKGTTASSWCCQEQITISACTFPILQPFHHQDNQWSHYGGYIWAQCLWPK